MKDDGINDRASKNDDMTTSSADPNLIKIRSHGGCGILFYFLFLLLLLLLFTHEACRFIFENN